MGYIHTFTPSNFLAHLTLGEVYSVSKASPVRGHFDQSAASPRLQARDDTNNTPVSIPVDVAFWICESTSVDIHAGAELLGHGILRYIVLLQQCLSPLSSGHTMYSSVRFSLSPYTCLHLVSSTLLIFATLPPYLDGVK